MPLPEELWQSDAYEDYTEHLHVCSACSDWYMEQHVVQRGYAVNQFPCVHIPYYGTCDCKQHKNAFDCPDVLVRYNQQKQTCGLPVRDGGSSIVAITCCPWCGVPVTS